MLDRTARETLAQETLAFSSADETEVLVIGEDAGLTRFTHNAIHQNLAHENLSVRVRAVIAGRVGVAVTNELDRQALRTVAARACEIARLAPRDEAWVPLQRAPRSLAPSGAFRETTAQATPALRAQLAAHVFSVAETEALWASGYVTTSHAAVTIANSAGTLCSFEGSDAGINVKQNAPDSTGFAERYSNDIADIDALRTATIAGGKAQSSRGPIAVEPGPWTVILEPPAFGELLSYLTDHFSAQAFDEGSSFLRERGLDHPYFSESVTIADDYAHPLSVGMPFDFEGTPKQRVTLVERGVCRTVVTDAAWAAKLGRPNTGHALPAPNAYGPQALNLVVAPGSKSTAQLIAETKRGLLVSRFWYIRPVDQRRALLTGMTRDGTFLIEDGKLTRGITNMRFNHSVLAALRDIELSSEQARTSGYSYSLVVPSAKIGGFTFTSGTEF